MRSFALFALLVLPTATQAWGPVTHGMFSCMARSTGGSVSDCMADTDPTRQSLLVGAGFPDAFYFGRLNISDPLDSCSDLSYMHDDMFAAYQYVFALSSAGRYTSPSDPFDAVNYSLGYLSHIASDNVGFDPRGMLCSDRVGCPAGTVLWISEWGFMTAIDSFFTAKYNISALALPTTSFLSTNAFRFISDASAYYNKVKPSFAPVTVEAVQRCSAFWSANLAYMYQRATFAADAQNMTPLERELTWFAPTSPLHPSPTWDDVSMLLAGQVQCAASAVQMIWKALEAQQPPAAAWQQTNDLVAALYKDNTCTGGY